jgi:LacI family transcriptional regulator
VGVAGSRVTLQDVAQRAGVSRTTASFVLTGRRDMRISTDTERRVIQAARELNYRPSLLARSLRTNLSQTIGLLSDLVASEAFAGEIVRGSMATALRGEHLMFIGETQGDPELERQLVHSMLDRGVSGFLYASMYTRTVRVSPTLREHRLVLLNTLSRGGRFTTVAPDELEAGRTAVRELIAHGHLDRIVLVGERATHIVAAANRVSGVQEVLGQHGTQLAGAVDTLWWPDPAQAAVSAYLAQGSRPTAFICLNDRIAFGTYQAIREAGLQIPGDVSVISFDGSDLATWMRPKLTSIAIPHFEMGRQAVELLLQPKDSPEVHMVSMPLQVGESVGPPRARHRRSSR